MLSGELINSSQLMDEILHALKKKKPLSVISVGQTEAFVMAQYKVFTEKEFMQHREAYIANNGLKLRGISFPNIKARDAAVVAVRKADIVGYNTIVAPARKLTEKVFKAYDIKPEWIFESNIRRVIMFSQKEKFRDMLRNRKILLIGSLAKDARKALQKNLQDKLGFKIVDAIPIYSYKEIPRIKKKISDYNFDLCLLGAGVNAVILAPYIARTHGKVAFDIGFGMKSLITGKVVTDSWITEIIGLKKLFKM